MEHIPTRLETLLPKILENFATELEDRFSTPGSWDQIDPEHIEMVRRGAKIPRTADKRELLIKIAQDYRLTSEETDELQMIVFEL